MVLLSRVAAMPAGAASGVRLSADGVNPVELPAFLGTEWIGRRTEITAVEREVLPADTGFARRNYVNVQSAQAVFFSVVLSGRDRTSIHRPELCLIGQGWSIRDRSRRALRWAGGSGAVVPATVLRTEQAMREGRTMPALTAYWFVSSEGAVATHWERLLRDAWSRVRHGRADRWAYVLMQTDGTEGDAAALARMEAVLAGVWPAVAVDGQR
jgi:EpsI family protein